jgi:O-methyltransferase
MKNIIIFGAGQSGRMIKKLLHGTCKSIFYMDNNYKNLPDFIDEIPVVSPKELTNIRPDKIIISVLNKEAAEEIHLWLIDEGIRESDILNIGSLTKLFDIRLSTLRLLSEEINEKKVEGNVAELGVYKGYLARELNLLFKDRKLYLFDTFTGFDARDIEYEKSARMAYH